MDLKEIEYKQVDTLQSGRFYWIRTISRCYRINEVDHFLKDLTTDILCFLDNQGMCHHFNRIESKFSATTPLNELLAIPNLKILECYEFPAKVINSLQKENIEQGEGNESLLMLKKVISSFYDKQEEGGIEYPLEEMKSLHMKEYIKSVELRH